MFRDTFRPAMIEKIGPHDVLYNETTGRLEKVQSCSGGCDSSTIPSFEYHCTGDCDGGIFFGGPFCTDHLPHFSATDKTDYNCEFHGFAEYKNGELMNIGSHCVMYNSEGHLDNIGGHSVFYDNQGYIERIGPYKVSYVDESKPWCLPSSKIVPIEYQHYKQKKRNKNSDIDDLAEEEQQGLSSWDGSSEEQSEYASLDSASEEQPISPYKTDARKTKSPFWTEPPIKPQMQPSTPQGDIKNESKLDFSPSQLRAEAHRLFPTKKAYVSLLGEDVPKMKPSTPPEPVSNNPRFFSNKKVWYNDYSTTVNYPEISSNNPK